MVVIEWDRMEEQAKPFGEDAGMETTAGLV